MATIPCSLKTEIKVWKLLPKLDQQLTAQLLWCLEDTELVQKEEYFVLVPRKYGLFLPNT